MKLFLIRHGQTDWNLEGRIQGSHDNELNDTGILQSRESGRKILELGYSLSKIYSSKLKRALKTAEIISETTNVKYEMMEGLEEISLGTWEGLTWAEVAEFFQKEYDEWYKNRRYSRPPNGESYQDMLDRVLKALDKIINENNNCGSVAIVTHSAIIMALQCYLTNTPFEEMTKFKANNTSIVEIDSEKLYKKINQSS